MNTDNNTSQQIAKLLRYIALSIGLIFAIFFILHVFVAVYELITGTGDPVTVERGLITLFIIIFASSVFIAFWRADIGGAILVVIGVLIGTYAVLSVDRSLFPPTLVTAVPSFAVGFILLISWRMSKR